MNTSKYYFHQLTTLHLGGEIVDYTSVNSVREIDAYHHDVSFGSHSFILGGGSNLVVSDQRCDTPIIHLTHSHFQIHNPSDDYAFVYVEAGMLLDDLIVAIMAEGFSGLEFLSGIPGTCGGAVVQNAGAYGMEISERIIRVQVYDRFTCLFHWWERATMQYKYRSSRLKHSQQYIVVAVQLRIEKTRYSLPVTFQELARTLHIDVGHTADSVSVRQGVLALRAAKGMIIDEYDTDTWSVGSFFVNPIVTAEFFYALQERNIHPIAHYVLSDQEIKIPAAWLIEHAGFPRGYTPAGSGVGLSHKHTLALCNRGHGTTVQLLDLAYTIWQSVNTTYGIVLQVEPVFLGCTWAGA